MRVKRIIQVSLQVEWEGKRVKSRIQETINMEVWQMQSHRGDWEGSPERQEATQKRWVKKRGQSGRCSREARKWLLETAGLAARGHWWLSKRSLRKVLQVEVTVQVDLICNRYTVLLILGNWDYVSRLTQKQGLLSQGIRKTKGRSQDVYVQHQRSRSSEQPGVRHALSLCCPLW